MQISLINPLNISLFTTNYDKSMSMTHAMPVLRNFKSELSKELQTAHAQYMLITSQEDL